MVSANHAIGAARNGRIARHRCCTHDATGWFISGGLNSSKTREKEEERGEEDDDD